MGRSEILSFQSIENCLDDAVDIGIDIGIPKPDDPKSQTHQRGITQGILRCVSGKTVLAAVDLDNQSMLEAQEIDDVTTDGCLSTKMKTHAPQATESNPHPDLLTGHRLS